MNQPDIFKEVTSMQELKQENTKMPSKKIDDFSEEDKVESNIDFWKHRENTEVIGLFKRWESDSYGEHAVLQTPEQTDLHLPNLKALNSKLKQANVSEGNKVKIVYVGEKKAEKSGRMYEDFTLYIKKE